MTKHIRKVRPAQKNELIEEAGKKCANPGCPNWRSHIHHIKHWHVYKCHDSADMIAICPSCHDAVHHGSLAITDEMLREWKAIARLKAPSSGPIYVEPGSKLKLLVGGIAILGNREQVRVFELSSANRLSLRVLDGDILQVNASLQAQDGKEILRVVENHVRVAEDSSVIFDYQPGHARITVPSTEKYVPAWVLRQMARVKSNFGADGRIVALDIVVAKPGVVKVQGCWCEGNVAAILADEFVYFCRADWEIPAALGASPFGAGEPPTVFLSDDAPITLEVLPVWQVVGKKSPKSPSARSEKDSTKLKGFARQYLANVLRQSGTVGLPELRVEFKDRSILTFLTIAGDPQLQALGTPGGFARRFVDNVKAYAFLEAGVGFEFRDGTAIMLELKGSEMATLPRVP